MGLSQSSLSLTQYDIEEVQAYCRGAFTQGEIVALYQRFRQLDKRHKGYITAQELQTIPELVINPLAQRVTQLFTNANFKDFVQLLAACAPGEAPRAAVGEARARGCPPPARAGTGSASGRRSRRSCSSCLGCTTWMATGRWGGRTC